VLLTEFKFIKEIGIDMGLLIELLIGADCSGELIICYYQIRIWIAIVNIIQIRSNISTTRIIY
jgi:hypothetical protein